MRGATWAIASRGFPLAWQWGWLVTTWAAVAVAADPPSTRGVAEHVLAATVGISSTTADGASFSGTGSVVTPTGHILTSTSVVPPDATEIRVMFPSFVRRKATLVAADADLAVSLIKVEADGLTALSIAR